MHIVCNESREGESLDTEEELEGVQQPHREDAKYVYIIEDGNVHYLLDHNEYHPISETITALTSSVTAFPDVGIVYNHSIVLCIEIQSSPMCNAVAKLAANLIDDCRYLRHFDLSKVVGFAFCNSKEKGYVCKVIIEWKNLAFNVSAAAMECKEDTILSDKKVAFDCHASYADNIINIIQKKHTPFQRYLIPYSQADVESLRSLLNTKPASLKQVESLFSLLLTDDSQYYYKYCT